MVAAKQASIAWHIDQYQTLQKNAQHLHPSCPVSVMAAISPGSRNKVAEGAQSAPNAHKIGVRAFRSGDAVRVCNIRRLV